MARGILIGLVLLFAAGGAHAEEPKAKQQGDKLMSGMSIVGNDEAPKSLVIVPWKTSQLGSTLDLARAFGPGRDPVDRDVFLRELDYYQIRVGEAGEPGPAPH
ncbi:MAG: hypothetical protein QNK04_12710 [Myxococcota bacterium]|nr:hypothetical protein [Myxococcota bacterium]